ncbi:MAG: hypothetical protein Q8R81_12120 [Novosphingobium sp.]|uniref:hypothetical protein n=1 Tax=Novosphingobium sp. TaxID=1874826 RepID=UPI00273339CC|nr:hypothetical protein [Novosphingobium sp.]MDP3551127.1 hypothetical protein [Novosphingobium sp.]
MPTDLDHFGTNTPRERELRLVLAEFEASFAFAGRNGNCTAISSRCWFKDPARGGWLDEPHEDKVYKALQDRLIVVNDAQVTARVRYGSQREERLMREYGVTAPLTAPVNFIVRTLGDVKQGHAQSHAQSHVHGRVKGCLQGRVQGRYCFIDVACDGIALYQNAGEELDQPRPKTLPDGLSMALGLSKVQALSKAQAYFAQWMPRAQPKQELATIALDKEYPKDAG